MQGTKNIVSHVACDAINETMALTGREIERYEIIIYKTCLEIHKIINNEIKIYIQLFLPISNPN
jgi:hypothetical protein